LFIIYRISLSVFILLSIVGCGPKDLFQNSSVVQSAKVKSIQQNQRIYKNIRFEYKIAPHDRIAIVVYKHKELSGKGILVDSQGIVRLPLIKEVRIGGLTQNTAAKKIQSRYDRYLKKPDVHLEVINKRAYIVGEVNRPGVVPLPNEQTTLLQAIAMTFGFRDSANREQIVIIRKTNSGTSARIVDLTNLTSLSYSGMMIQPNDIIYVAPSSIKRLTLGTLPILSIINSTLSPFLQLKSLVN